MVRLTDEELEAEYSRAAAVVGIHGPHSYAKHVIITHRFLTTPHYDKEPVMTSHEAPEATVAAYEESIQAIPAVRIPFRVHGFKAGWLSAMNYAVNKPAGEENVHFDGVAREYDGSLRLDGIAVARRRSSYNGFKDGWEAALKEAKK